MAGIGFGGGSPTIPSFPESAAANPGRLYPLQRPELWYPFDSRVAVPGDLDPAAFSTQAIMRAYLQADKDWMLVGTNAASALCTGAAGGGVQIQTGTATDDQMVIVPLEINSVVQRANGWVEWSPQARPVFVANIRTGSVTTAQRIVCGFGLTRTAASMDYGNDNDAVYFAYDTTHASSAGSWHCISSVAGTDQDDVAAGSYKATTLKASTEFSLRIDVALDNKPYFYVDDVLVGIGPQLTSSAVLTPLIGIHNRAVDVTARSMIVRGLGLARNAF